MKKNKMISWETLLMFIYMLITGFTVLNHEPWRDEAQAWLIARDLPVLGIFHQMAYEGSPGLWHMLLMPLAKLGLPYISMNLLNLLILWLAAGVFMYKSVFSKITKILFLFSYYMAWEYSIIARSYGLSVLFLFAIAALDEQRFKKPLIYAGLIFLLFNTNAHSCFLAMCLLLSFLWESWQDKQFNKQRIFAMLIMLSGAGLAFSQLISPQDNMNYGICAKFDSANLFYAIRYAFFPCSPNITAYLCYLAGILILISGGVYIYKTSLRVFGIILGAYSGLFYLYLCKSVWGYRHFGFVLILLLFGLWLCVNHRAKLVAAEDNKSITGNKFFSYQRIILVINICLAISILPTGLRHYQEYKFLFSGAKEMAEYLKNNQLTGRIIVAHESAYASALLPYLVNKKFWYADIEQSGTFITWNKKYKENAFIPFAEVENRINKHVFPKDKILILLNHEIPAEEAGKYQLLYKVRTTIFGNSDEQYYLYKSISA
jgi:hypothetical protein